MAKKHSVIEKIAESIGIIPNLHKDREDTLHTMTYTSLEGYPPSKSGITGRSMKPNHGLKK